MAITRVSDKGQITLPADIRRKFDIKSRSRVEIEARDSEIIIRPIKSVMDLSGIFHECAKGKTTDWETIRSETERIVAEEVAREGFE